MPLRDHFHPPLDRRCGWQSIHMMWAGAILNELNSRLLSHRYRAEGEMNIGGSMEIDVGTLDTEEVSNNGVLSDGDGGVATLAWAPPAPPLVFPMNPFDLIEVRILDSRSQQAVVGAIELVSPGNKDCDEARTAFVRKMAHLIQNGVGVVVVDIVTNRLANFHNDLIEALQLEDNLMMPTELPAYAVAYSRDLTDGIGHVRCWPHPLAVGEPLADMPLALRGGSYIKLDLETTYETACRQNRVT